MKRGDELLVQDRRQEGDQRQEDEHADQEHARRRQRPMHQRRRRQDPSCRLLAIPDLRCPPLFGHGEITRSL